MDLCISCQKHRDGVCSALTEEEKIRATGASMDHIRKAQREREFYNECMRKCKEPVEASIIIPGTSQPSSTVLSDIHYLFDVSQVFAIQHMYQQVRPLYFGTPKKVFEFATRAYLYKPTCSKYHYNLVLLLHEKCCSGDVFRFSDNSSLRQLKGRTKFRLLFQGHQGHISLKQVIVCTLCV